MTTETLREPTEEQLNDVFVFTLKSAFSSMELRKKIMLAGDHPKTKYNFYVADMANYLMTKKAWESGDNAMKAKLADCIAQAKRALDTSKRCAHGKCVKGKKPRTKTEEAAKSRSATRWSLMLKECGMKAVGKNAGNSNARGTRRPAVETKVETKVVEPKAPTTPRCATTGELQDHIAVAVAKLVALIELPNNKANKRHRVFSEALQAAHAAMLEDK